MSEPTDTTPTHTPGHRASEASTERTLLRTDVARVLSSEAYGSVKVLSHEAADRVFTPKRREILRLLKTEAIDSQRELARELGRDPGAVQRDLQELRQADLIEIVEDGRANRPVLAHDTIIVEPLIAPDTVGGDATYSVDTEP